MAITCFTIQDFTPLHDATLAPGRTAVFIGPNHPGRTTALQALASWDVGWRRGEEGAQRLEALDSLSPNWWRHCASAARSVEGTSRP